MYACRHACMHAYIFASSHPSMHLCIYVSLHLCIQCRMRSEDRHRAWLNKILYGWKCSGNVVLRDVLWNTLGPLWIVFLIFFLDCVFLFWHFETFFGILGIILGPLGTKWACFGPKKNLKRTPGKITTKFWDRTDFGPRATLLRELGRWWQKKIGFWRQLNFR